MSDKQVQHKVIQNLSEWHVLGIQSILVRTLQTLKCHVKKYSYLTPTIWFFSFEF